VDDLDATQAHSEILATGKFVSARLTCFNRRRNGRILPIQHTTDSKETFERYYQEDAQGFRAEIMKLFGEKFCL
jgi:hypothetical protein